MFLISTRYGLIACRYLVESYYLGRYTSAPEIASRYNMNVRALMPALRQMTRAGILRSRVGGKDPGFIFSKDPAGISVHQVVVAIEGDYSFECCRDMIPDLKCDCKDKSKCKVRMLLDGVLKDRAVRFSLSVNEYASGCREVAAVSSN